MNKFIINDFLTLKLEGGETNIYVNGKLFNQSKYLMLNIPKEKIDRFNEIESIDEAADILGWTDERQLGVEYAIDPESEFWGHCSNLQAWYENFYDTRLLHSNLAFPLLKKLTEVGDPLAMKAFKEEIANRFQSGYPTVIAYIFKSQLLDSLNKEERIALFKESVPIILTAIEKLSDSAKYEVFNSLIDEGKKTEILEKYFTSFLQSLDKFPVFHKNISFSHMFDSIKNTKLLNIYSSQIKTQFFALLESIDFPGNPAFFKVVKETNYIEENFCVFLETIEKLCNDDRRSAFSILLKLTKETICKEENFPLFLERIKKILSQDKYRAFSGLINIEELTVEKEEHNYAFVENIDKLLFKSTYRGFSYQLNIAKETGNIDEYFPAFLETIEKLSHGERGDAFSTLLELIKETGSFEAHISAFLETIEKFSYYREQRDAFSALLKVAKETDNIEEYLTAFLETIEKLSAGEQQDAFSNLLELTKETKLIEENLSNFMNSVGKLHDGNIKFVFSELIKISNESGWIKEHIPTFLKHIDKIKGNHKYDTFYVLINTIKNTGLLNKYYSQIETQVFILLDNIDKLLEEDKYGAFSRILEVTKETELIEENFLFFLGSIKKIYTRDLYRAFASLINAIKSIEYLDKYYSEIKIFFLVLLKAINRIEYRRYDAFSALFQIAKKTWWIEDLFSEFLESLDSMSIRPFSDLFYIAKEKGWIEEQFHNILEAIDKVNARERYDAFSMLFKELKETRRIEEQFLDVLKTINKVPSEAMYHAFSDLINFAKNTDLYDTYHSQIEAQFLVHLKNIKNVSVSVKFYNFNQNWSYRYLLEIAKETGWIEKHFSAFLEPFVKVTTHGLYYSYENLMDFVKSTDLLKIHYSQIENQFLVLLNNITILDYTEKYRAFIPLIHSVKDTNILKKYFHQVENQFLAIWESLVKLTNDNHSDKDLSSFFHVIQETGLIENNILALLETVGKLPGYFEDTEYLMLINAAIEKDELEKYFPVFLKFLDKLPEKVKYFCFSALIGSIKSPEVLKKYFSHIESKFFTLLNDVDKIPEYNKYDPFCGLLGVAKRCNLLKDYFPAFLELIKKIDYKKYDIFSDLFKIAIENGWIEEFFPAILDSIGELSDEDKYNAFSEIMDAIKGADLIKGLISDIKNPFLILLNNINQLKIMSDDGAIIVNYTVPLQLNTFANLINSIKNTELLLEFYPQIKSQIQTLVNRYGMFKSKYIEFFKEIKGTELENEPEFKKWKVKNSI